MGAVVEVDESFKKPGAIPFKWETRPGVPKSDQPDPPFDNEEHHPTSRSLPCTPLVPIRLTPPPRTRSLRPISSLRSESFHLTYPDPDPPLLARPESASIGCFLSPRLKWKWGWKKSAAKRGKPKLETGHDHRSELESSLTRWSISSTRKSLSSLRGSPRSLSFSSHRSSP